MVFFVGSMSVAQVLLVSVSVFLFLGEAFAVRVELHFMSECHECQMHIAAINNNVFTGGLEYSLHEAGVLEELELSVDYYGNLGSDGLCEHGDLSPHGPQQCEIDRFHVCAQDILGGTKTGAAMKWWPFVHCLFMNLDFLKCGSNWYCEDYSQFAAARDSIVSTCAAVTGVDHEALLSCANSTMGRKLQAASFNRTNSLPPKFGFAPPFVQGEYVKGTEEMMWRLSPDQLQYGQAILGDICEGLQHDDINAAACVNMTKSN